jgi:hypothetical protein
LFAIAFGATSIFSSQVTKDAGLEVLIDSPNCGWWGFPTTGNGTGWQLKILNDTKAAASYARSCYGTNNQNTPPCNTYKVPKITWTSDETASCPFAAEACGALGSTPYQMDTGHLDSHDILGLNAEESDRVTLRRVATCSAMHTKPYYQYVNQSTGDGNLDQDLQLFMGKLDSTGLNYT